MGGKRYSLLRIIEKLIEARFSSVLISELTFILERASYEEVDELLDILHG
jgi:hypothetical protein